MNHNSSAVIALSPSYRNNSIYQKTFGFNDFYLSDGEGGPPLGNVQLLGRVSGKILKANMPQMPEWLLERVSGHAVDPKVCDATSMENAITLATWFANEAIRIVAVQSICAHDKELFEFTDWLARRGGNATTREVCRSLNRLYPTFEHALKIMQKLVDTKVAVWKTIDPGPQGGPPVHYISMGISPVRPADSFTHEDTWDPHPKSKPEPAKPAKKSGGKNEPKTMEYWDAMYPTSDDFRAFLKGRKKEQSDE